MMENIDKSIMECYTEVEVKTADLLPKVQSMIGLDEVKSLLNEFVNIEKILEKCLAESTKKINVAEKKQKKAKDYRPKFYKVGSDKKKARLLAEAQAFMMEALTCLQKGQAIMFRFQQILTSFSRKCMSLCLDNQIDINDLANILLDYDKKSDESDLPNGVYAEILQLKQEIENLSKLRKKDLKK